MKRRHPRFRFVVEAVPWTLRPGDPPPAPPALRVRALLKHAWRALGLRAVSVEEVRDGPEGNAGEAG